MSVYAHWKGTVAVTRYIKNSSTCSDHWKDEKTFFHLSPKYVDLNEEFKAGLLPFEPTLAISGPSAE